MFGLHNTHTNATCKEHSNSKYNCDNINSDNDTAQVKRGKITIISVNIKSFRNVTWIIWQNYDDTFCFPPCKFVQLSEVWDSSWLFSFTIG